MTTHDPSLRRRASSAWLAVSLILIAAGVAHASNDNPTAPQCVDA